MNELNWLKLSGLMRRCLYNSENPQCPFADFRNQDYFQQVESLTGISDNYAQQLLVSCNSCRNKCKMAKSKVMAINNPRNFRIVG